MNEQEKEEQINQFEDSVANESMADPTETIADDAGEGGALDKRTQKAQDSDINAQDAQSRETQARDTKAQDVQSTETSVRDAESRDSQSGETQARDAEAQHVQSEESQTRDTTIPTPGAQDSEGPGVSTAPSSSKKAGGPKKFLHILPTIVLLVIILILAIALGRQVTRNRSLTSQLEEVTSSLNSLTGSNDDLADQNEDLSDRVEDLVTQVDTLTADNKALTDNNRELTDQNKELQEQYDETSEQVKTLTAKVDELENGAAQQLVEVKNAYESGDWKDVVTKAAALHKKYNGSAEDKEAQELSTKAQAKLDEAAKAAEEKKAKGYETGITYDQLARTPDDYFGQKCKFSGKVLQVIEGDSEVDLRIAVNSDYDKVIYCVYDPDITSTRVLEDDQVTIYGTSIGTISYQSTFGGQITIPGIYVDKIEIH